MRATHFFHHCNILVVLFLINHYLTLIVTFELKAAVDVAFGARMLFRLQMLDTASKSRILPK